MLKLECDRCGQSSGKVDIYGVEPHPYSNMSAPRPAMYQMAEGWKCVLGKDLCPKCVQVKMTNLFAYEQMGRNGGRVVIATPPRDILDVKLCIFETTHNDGRCEKLAETLNAAIDAAFYVK